MIRPVSGSSPRGDRWWRHTVVVLFALTAALVLSRHEMWMDELNPWLIARDAHSLPELFFNMRFEPHPALWYLCLYAVTRVTRNPDVMQVLHGLIATASVAVVAYCSPFRKRDVVLLAFSYYFIFEFCAISRGYALGLLLLLGACATASAARPRPILIAILLGLAANTSAFGLIAAVALAVALAPMMLPAGRSRSLAAAAIAGTLFVASMLALLPSRESIFGSDRHLAWSWPQLDATVRLICDALLPLPDVTNPSPWNSNAIERLTRFIPVAGHYVPLILGCALIALAFIQMRGRPLLRAALIAGTGMMLTLIYVQYSGGYRHHGQIFVLLLALLWIDARSTSRETPSWLTGVLAVQMIAGLYFVQADVRRPFSESELLVRFLEEQPHDLAIVAAQPTILNYEGPELAAYLRRHIYYATAGGIVPGGYMWYDRARGRDASEAEIVGEIERFAEAIGGDVLVVTSRWNPTTLGDPIFQSREPTLEGDERNSAVYLYRRQSGRQAVRGSGDRKP